MSRYAKVSDLIGKTLVRATQIGNDRIEFEDDSGKRWVLFHYQECCESVSINDINGDLDFLVGSPILLADEATNATGQKPSEWAGSFLWTFYRFGTQKGYVDIRWLGESNGYYGVGVTFAEMT